MLYKHLLTCILALLSSNIFSMDPNSITQTQEEIEQDQLSPEVALLKRKLEDIKGILYQSTDHDTLLKHAEIIKITDANIKRIIKNLKITGIDLANAFYDIALPSLSACTSADAKIAVFNQISSGMLGVTTSAVIKLYAPNIATKIQLFQEILGQLRAMLAKGNDLFDKFFDFAKRNEVELFFKTIKELTPELPLVKLIEKYVNDDNTRKIIETVQNNYEFMAKNKLFSKYIDIKFGKSLLVFAVIASICMEVLSDESASLVNKLIHEPTINNKCLLVMQKNFETQLQFLAAQNHCAMIKVKERLTLLIKQIVKRIETVRNLKTRLFSMVNTGNIRATYITAHYMYVISQDFQDELTGDTPLHLAIRMRNKELIKHLVAVCPEMLDVANNTGNTPIMEAISQPGMFEFLKEIVTKLNPNV